MSQKAGWATGCLDDFYWFQEGPGVRKWQFRDSGVKLLNVANIEKSKTINLNKTNRYLEETEVAARYSHFLIDDGDLVIASSGISFDDDGYLRTRGAFVREEHLPLCLNTSTIRFKSKEGKSSLGFLHHWLDSKEFRAQITRLVTGSAQQNFGPSHLKAIQITLPPLPEQRRITAILDQADALRAKRREALAQLDSLAQSIFIEMFGDPVSNPMRWNTSSLADACYCYSGGTPSKSNPDYWSGDLPWFSAKDLKRDDLFDAQDHINRSVTATTSLKLLPADTVAIVVRGMILAHTFPVSVLRVPSTINQDLKALLPRVEIEPQFLAASLRAQSKYALSQVSEAGHGTKRLDADALKNIPVLLPPMDLQQRFTVQVRKIEALRGAHRNSTTELEALFASLQHRAFRGEL